MRLDERYIAGFLDADGSIYMCRFARKEDRVAYYYGRVTFVSQNLAVLVDLQETLGGRIRMEDCGSGAYQLVLDSKGAVSCLKKVSQYLRIKRDQADLLLRYQEIVDRKKKQMSKCRGKDAVMDERELQERRDVYLLMKQLNKRDSQAFKTNRVNSVKTLSGATPSQAAAANDSAEGVTTRGVSANDNPLHEDPARKGRHSLDSTEAKSIQ